MQKYYMPSPRFPNPVRHSQNPSGQIIFSGLINAIDMTFTLCNWRLKPSVLSGLNVLLTSRIWKLGLEIKSKWPIIIDVVYINNRTWLIHWLSDSLTDSSTPIRNRWSYDLEFWVSFNLGAEGRTNAEFVDILLEGYGKLINMVPFA